MQSRTRALRRLIGRSAVLATSLPLAALVIAPTAAAASGQVETNTMTFGLLGPVGIIAVTLGVLGMVAGVIRQRRKARELPGEETAQLAAVTSQQAGSTNSGPVAGIRPN